MAFRLTSTTARQVSIGSSSIGTAGAPMPALLKSTSSRPQLSFTLAKMARTFSGRVMSAGSTMARSLAPDSAAVFSKSSARLPTSATW